MQEPAIPADAMWNLGLWERKAGAPEKNGNVPTTATTRNVHTRKVLLLCSSLFFWRNEKGMRKTILAVLAVLSLVLAGCGATVTANSPSADRVKRVSEPETTTQPDEAQFKEAQTEAESQEVQQEAPTKDEDFSFKTLSTLTFEYVPEDGMGSETFNIAYDGSFAGSFQYLDLNDTGEGYETGGTLTCCSYEGMLHNLEKIDNLTYRVRCDGIKYKDQPGAQIIESETKKIYVTSRIFDEDSEFTIYLVGTKTENLPEEVWKQLHDRNTNDAGFVGEKELLDVCMVESKSNIAFNSFVKESALKQAEDIYDNYKDVYDNYVEKVCSFVSTKEANDNMEKAYNAASECMDRLMQLLETDADGTTYDRAVKDQLIWQKKRDSAAESAKAAYNGNPIGIVDYTTVMAEMTMDRCEEMVNYFK